MSTFKRELKYNCVKETHFKVNCMTIHCNHNSFFCLLIWYEVKGKGHPITKRKSPDEESRYSSTPSLTSALDGVGDKSHVPADLAPRKRPSNPCTRDWVGRRAGLD